MTQGVTNYMIMVGGAGITVMSHAYTFNALQVADRLLLRVFQILKQVRTHALQAYAKTWRLISNTLLQQTVAAEQDVGLDYNALQIVAALLCYGFESTME